MPCAAASTQLAWVSRGDATSMPRSFPSIESASGRRSMPNSSARARARPSDPPPRRRGRAGDAPRREVVPADHARSRDRDASGVDRGREVGISIPKRKSRCGLSFVHCRPILDRPSAVKKGRRRLCSGSPPRASVGNLPMPLWRSQRSVGPAIAAPPRPRGAGWPAVEGTTVDTSPRPSGWPFRRSGTTRNPTGGRRRMSAKRVLARGWLVREPCGAGGRHHAAGGRGDDDHDLEPRG